MGAKRDVVASYAGKTVLAFGAHPDDMELGAGGTIALLTQAGARVVMAVVSVPTQLEARVLEAARGAALLGAESRILNARRCSRVEDLKVYELVERVEELVRELDPAAVLTHGSSNFHRDHLLVYHACLAAQRRHFFDLFCYTPTSSRPSPIPFRPQAYVDITPTMDVKMEAIGVHSSQFAGRGLPFDYYRDEARNLGRLAGVQYAEGLEVMRLALN